MFLVIPHMWISNRKYLNDNLKNSLFGGYLSNMWFFEKTATLFFCKTHFRIRENISVKKQFILPHALKNINKTLRYMGLYPQQTP